MNLGNINLKTKIEIGLIIVMIAIVSACSVSSLLSITDDNITDSTHGVIIDFDNASAFFVNMTTENATFTQNVTFNRPFAGQVYNQATPPNIPAGTIAWWLNSTDGNLSVIVDIGGAQYYVCNGTGPGGGVYVAGDGLNLTGATFSFDGLVFDENLSWDGQYLNATDTDTTYSSGTGINITDTTFSFNGTYGNAQYLQHALFGSNGLIKRTGAGTYSIVTDSSSNWNTAHGWGDHSTQNYLDDDVADDVDDADIDWGAGAGQVNTDDVPEGATNFWCDLARIQSLLTNDFHNIGGTDDDVPESGDFGAAGDLNADGTITDGSVSEAKLDVDNAPVDEYVLTWESGSGKMHWQAESAGGADGYAHDGKIHNSNGNSYTISRANLQTAIDDLVSSPGYGSVWVGGALSMDGTPIYPKSNILIDFGMNKVTFASDGEFINLTGGCRRATVQNAYVDPYAGTTEGIITVYADGNTAPDSVRFNTIKNIDIVGGSTDKAFIGIHLQCVDDQSILDCRFEDVYTNYAGTGIKLECTHSGGYINGNIFDNVYVDYFIKMIEIDQVAGDIDYNTFQDVRGQAVDSVPLSYHSEYGVIVEGKGNVFNEVLPWDWWSVVGDQGVYHWEIKSNAIDTEIKCMSMHDNSVDNGDNTHITILGGEINNGNDYDYVIGQMYGDDTDYYLYYSELGRVINTYDNVCDCIEQALSLKGSQSNPTRIFIKPGTYNVGEMINHDNMGNVLIEGAGPTKTIFSQSANIATYQAMIYIYSSSGTVENVTIKGIGFKGNSATITDGGGIRLRNWKNIEIIDCHFYDTDDLAIWYAENEISNWCIIDNCKFWDISSGKTIQFNIASSADNVNNVTVRDCYFDEITVDCISFDIASTIQGFYVYNNNFHGCTDDILRVANTGTLNNFMFNENIITGSPANVLVYAVNPLVNITVNNIGYSP